MDESSQNIIKEFEFVLKNNAKKTPLALYSASKSDRARCVAPENSYRAQDIITSVNKQIKNIQRADSAVANKQVNKILNKDKKSSFLPVNMLPREPEVINKKAANRFETQCVSDTQLINIIDNAEAIANSNDGITQEFDSTFYDNDNEKCIVGENNTTTSNKPIVHKDNICVDSENLALDSNLSFKGATSKEFNELFTDKISCHKVTECSISVSQDREVLNKVADNISFKEDKTHARDDVISPSPIFQVPRSKSHSPLVFDLGSFEKFEKIALPIIEENSDLTAAKQLINSQIIEKELLLQANVKSGSSLVNEQTSPVLKVSSELLKITKHTEANNALIIYNNKDENPTQRNKKINDTFLQDEILFSSDEEEEYVHKELQDIPLTCALETSFYEQPDVHIPINVSNSAIEKSKKVLETIDAIDNINCKDKLNPLSNAHQVRNKRTEDVLDKVLSREIEEQSFKGFKTANNKPINISSEALAKSRTLVQDIDCEDKIDSVTTTNKHIDSCTTKYIKPVMLKEKSTHKTLTLSKHKELFKDVDIECNSFKKVTAMSDVPNNNLNVFKGFQTASNKHIGVSSEALARSKAIFQDLDQEYNGINQAKNDTPFEGFHTASNKRINVSSEALLQSKLVFKDIDNDELQINAADDSSKIDIGSFKGFQTANKKPVTISVEALARSKMLFKDIEEDVGKLNLKNIAETFTGFKKTQKSISVSSEAVAKSKALFKDIDNVEYTFEEKLNKFKGFQTGNKKPVLVSEEALAKSKRIFEEIKENEINSTQFCGFQTASNKQVKISEDSLKKTREIFQEIDLTQGEYKENIIEEDFNMIQAGIKIGKEYFKEFKQPLKNLEVINKIENTPKLNTQLQKHTLIPVENNLDNLIDTQIINDFQEQLSTEDFHDDNARRSKRSGSPIISCPKAKRRKKFETPYRSGGNIAIVDDLKIASKNPDSVILFNNDYKRNKRLKLSHLTTVEGKYDIENSKKTVDPYILNFNLDTFQDFKFFGQRNDLNSEKLTIEDIKDIFVKAVNKKLIPIGWIENHIKLIVWKLLSYEIKFSHTLYGVCTVKNVLNQLKYRYDRELYNAERPAIRKILEKDDVASKTIVFCVAGIIVDGLSVKGVTNISSNVELVLTDGWYCIKAVIDKMLTKLVYDEKITVGSKIVTNGAELLNCEQGVAPWEDTSSVRLRISGNSTRRARWDARLGYHGNAAILTRLSSVKLDGGKVSKLRLFVARVYPMLYVEKFEDGSTVTRSERLENIHQVKYESERQIMMEKLYEEVEKELSDQESQDSTLSQMAGKHLKSSADFRITESQAKSFEDRTNRKREKLLQNVQERVRKKIEKKGMNVNRNVVTLLKLRVAGIEGCGSNVIVTKGLMSIWKPNDFLTEIVREGAWIEVMNIVPTAMRYSEIQLSAGRQSLFNQIKYKENENIKQYTNSLKRKCYHIKDLAQNPTMSTDYNEIDTVGLIFQIDEATNQPFQNMYLTDTEKNVICINFWGGLRKCGFQNVLNVGQIIYGTNLQKRAGNTRKSVPHFRVTEFTNFTKTPKNVVVRSLMDDMEKIFSGMDRKKYCDECIIFKNNYSTKCTTENISPYRFNNDHNLTKNTVFIDSPLAKCDDNINLTGLDFESTFKQTDTQDMSPKVLQRKKIVKQKIARLKMIGEPPPLSPLNIINKSKTAFNSYRSPLAQTSVARTKNEQSNNDNNIQSSPVIQTCNRSYQHSVSSVKKSTNSSISKEYQSSPLIESNVDTTKIHKKVNSEILPSSARANVASTKIFYQNSRIESDVLQSSPVFSMNRTYVKNVNPVKLNFSNADDSLVEVEDHFAEEFNGSPPLSLD